MYCMWKRANTLCLLLINFHHPCSSKALALGLLWGMVRGRRAVACSILNLKAEFIAKLKKPVPVRLKQSCRLRKWQHFAITKCFSFFLPDCSTSDAITAELLTITQGKLEALPTPAPDTSFPSTTDTSLPLNPSIYTLPHNLASTPDRRGDAKGADQQLSWNLWPCFTPIDNSLSPSTAEEASLELFKGSFPYEHLFDLALPKLASLYVERRTCESQQKAGREEVEVGDLSATSPLEVLDRLIQQGHDLHEKVLKR